jgi:hypothetical protein
VCEACASEGEEGVQCVRGWERSLASKRKPTWCDAFAGSVHGVVVHSQHVIITYPDTPPCALSAWWNSNPCKRPPSLPLATSAGAGNTTNVRRTNDSTATHRHNRRLHERSLAGGNLRITDQVRFNGVWIAAKA